MTSRWSPGLARLLAPLESSLPELELATVLGQGLIQPPLAQEPDSELEVDQPGSFEEWIIVSLAMTKSLFPLIFSCLTLRN